jgi:hypothetical protein
MTDREAVRNLLCIIFLVAMFLCWVDIMQHWVRNIELSQMQVLFAKWPSFVSMLLSGGAVIIVILLGEEKDE